MTAASLLDHIARWRASLPVFDTSGLLPWHMEGQLAGWVRPELADRLLASDAFERSANGLMLTPGIGGPISKSRALQHLAEQLRDEGLVPGWRGELHDYVDDWGRVRCTLERAAFRVFGLRSRAVHVNGYSGEDTLWLGRRAAHKATDPGMLDNIAAGLVGSGETPLECMVRELAEEAGVPRYLAMLAQPVGMVHSRRLEQEGVHDELLCCYDLDLPVNFVPVNIDGEVAEFLAVDSDRAAERLPEMTWDAGLVTAEWLGRWLDAEV